MNAHTVVPEVSNCTPSRTNYLFLILKLCSCSLFSKSLRTIFKTHNVLQKIVNLKERVMWFFRMCLKSIIIKFIHQVYWIQIHRCAINFIWYISYLLHAFTNIAVFVSLLIKLDFYDVTAIMDHPNETFFNLNEHTHNKTVAQQKWIEVK